MATGLLYHRMKLQRVECFCVQRKGMALGLRSFHWLGESLVIKQEHEITDNQLLHGCSNYHLGDAQLTEHRVPSKLHTIFWFILFNCPLWLPCKTGIALRNEETEVLTSLESNSIGVRLTAQALRQRTWALILPPTLPSWVNSGHITSCFHVFICEIDEVCCAR